MEGPAVEEVLRLINEGPIFLPDTEDFGDCMYL